MNMFVRPPAIISLASANLVYDEDNTKIFKREINIYLLIKHRGVILILSILVPQQFIHASSTTSSRDAPFRTYVPSL